MHFSRETCGNKKSQNPYIRDHSLKSCTYSTSTTLSRTCILLFVIANYIFLSFHRLTSHLTLFLQSHLVLSGGTSPAFSQLCTKLLTQLMAAWLLPLGLSIPPGYHVWWCTPIFAFNGAICFKTSVDSRKSYRSVTSCKLICPACLSTIWTCDVWSEREVQQINDKSQDGEMGTGLILCVTTYKTFYSENNMLQPITYLA